MYLDNLKEKGKLSALQSEVFIIARPHQELYDCNADPGQFLNVASLPQYREVLDFSRSVLMEWMNETSDNIPENLPKDWYLRERS